MNNDGAQDDKKKKQKEAEKKSVEKERKKSKSEKAKEHGGHKGINRGSFNFLCYEHPA